MLFCRKYQKMDLNASRRFLSITMLLELMALWYYLRIFPLIDLSNCIFYTHHGADWTLLVFVLFNHILVHFRKISVREFYTCQFLSLFKLYKTKSCSCRSLQNHRTRIHKNLFAAISVQVVVRLVIYIDQNINQFSGSVFTNSTTTGIQSTVIAKSTIIGIIFYK